ncbi:hypothetical protein ACSBR1_015338 [Camellia fascicularis]
MSFSHSIENCPPSSHTSTHLRPAIVAHEHPSPTSDSTTSHTGDSWETCRRDHSTVMQRSLNFRLRCLGLWTSLSTHFTAIKISSLGNIFGMVVNIFVYGGHVLV